LEYAVGSLQGRARDRFEVLMDTHFYLKATVDAYEAKFANLVELLPEKKPSDAVWNNIQSHIKESAIAQTSVQEEKTPWWKTNLFKQGFGFVAACAVVVIALNLDPKAGSINPNAIASYTAAMEYDANGQAIATTKIQKSDMKLTIDIMKPMPIAEGMELTLWCNPKSGGKPMKMGTISKTGVTKLDISEEEWINLQNIGSLAVTVEKQGRLCIDRLLSRKLIFQNT